MFTHPCLYAGDFNCRHADWGYDVNSPDGKCLAGWASINCLVLQYNAKDAASFYSGRWNTDTSPDLAFASVGPKRHVLEKFPRSQHRPSLITPPRFVMAVPSMPVKRWNFRKAKWSHYIDLTNKFARLCCGLIHLMSMIDHAWFTIKKAVKRLFHAGIEITMFRVGMQSVNISIKPFCSLLRETIQVWLLQLCLPSLTQIGGIDGPKQFGALPLHTSRKALSILNNLTGRSRHSPRHCLVLADAIASQLVRNGKYEAVDHKSSRLVSREVSDLWRATTSDPVNISDTFSQREFTVALQHLKPGRAPGPDSICPELILHAEAVLKSYLCDFHSSCLRRLKIPKIWRRAL